MAPKDGATAVPPTLTAHQDHQTQARESPSAIQSTRKSALPGGPLVPSLSAENSQAEPKTTLVSKITEMWSRWVDKSTETQEGSKGT